MSDDSVAPEVPEPHHAKHRRDDVPVDAINGVLVEPVVSPLAESSPPAKAKARAKAQPKSTKAS